MAPHGYTWYHLRGEATPQPIQELTVDPSHTHLMYLLAPRPVDARVWRRTAAWRAALERTGPAQAAAPALPYATGVFGRYRALVGSASEGAVLRNGVA